MVCNRRFHPRRDSRNVGELEGRARRQGWRVVTRTNVPDRHLCPKHRDDLTLTEVLELHGYTHRADERTSNTGKREIVDRDGVVVLTATAGDTWEWLRERGLWPGKP